MRGYSLAAILRHGLRRNLTWPEAIRHPEPKSRYDAVIVGGGGHGLATAYYLAAMHGITDVAVLERGWIGGGNTGRNTTIVRSNYGQPANSAFYEHSLKLWEGLSRELNFNVMLSQRGLINTFHTSADREAWIRRYNFMRLRGIDAELLSREDLAERVPAINLSTDLRLPVLGGVLQPRGGIAHHDAVAWGYARAADAKGIDIIQNCEVTGIVREAGRVVGVETSRGRIDAGKVGICVAGSSSEVARLAGIRLPIETHLLQALVSEPVKPFLDVVVSAGDYGMYISQTDKGEVLIGGPLDGYNSYSQRGSPATIERVLASAIELFPAISRLRMMRHWAGANDMTMDGSPIISRTPVEGLYFNGGWCYGGFKATPASGWTFAYTMAEDRPHPLNEPFALERFETAHLISERGAGRLPGLH